MKRKDKSKLFPLPSGERVRVRGRFGNLTFGICLKFVIWHFKFTSVFLRVLRGSVLRNMYEEDVGGLAGGFFLFLIPGVEVLAKVPDSQITPWDDDYSDPDYPFEAYM